MLTVRCVRQVTTPYELAFSDEETVPLIDSLVTVCFCLDILVNFNTAVSDSDLYVVDRKTIAQTYARNWLGFDVVSSVPWGEVTQTRARAQSAARPRMRLPGVLLAARACARLSDI